MNISAKLNDWEKHRLITGEQKQNIINFENQIRRPMFIYSLVFLSCFCIGLGIIALIAANWEQISPAVKLGIDFILLAVNGAALYWAFGTKHRRLFNGLIILFGLLILGSIGLIAQIYHLPPHGLQFLVLWCLLTLPLLFLAEHPFFPFMWLMAAYAAWLDYLYHTENQYLSFLREEHSLLLSWLIPALLLTAYFILKKCPLSAFAKAAWLWCVILTGCLTVALDFQFDSSFYHLHTDWKNYSAWPLQASSLLLLAVLGWFSRRDAVRYGVIALAVLLAYTFAVPALASTKLGADFAGALLTIGLLFLCAVYAYRCQRPHLLNALSVLIALRFFIIYLQVFGTLLTTGLGLIASGMVFLLLAIIWRRINRRLGNDLQEKKDA